MTKRAADIIIAAASLLILSPLLMAVAIAVRMDSAGPILFRQERVGRSFVPFHILKFRTMVHNSEGLRLTVGRDSRVTRTGRFLRRSKLDELPQLFNVLRGEMSLVGPRPEVPEFVELFRSDYEVILTVRPGMTDLASVRYVDEASLLANAADPRSLYINEVLPHKIELAKEYVDSQSLALDARIMAGTLFAIVGLHKAA